MRMLGRDTEPQFGQRGTCRERIVASSMSRVSPFVQIASPQGVVHWRWWIEPWTSRTRSSGKPAFWNWPSTLEVMAKSGRRKRSAQPRRIAKPRCGTVAR
jgi:hypothetical protein